MTGFVKRVLEKGFGFITPDDGSDDIFFHSSSLTDGLLFDASLEQREVVFDVERSDRGRRATRVRPVR